jgi:electron transfer flavoprotein beta subunit
MAFVNVVVCIKQVPDSWAEKALLPADQTLDRASVDAVLNDLDEYAVEAALQLVEAHGGAVTVLTVGPERAGEAIRKALTMGAEAGVHVVDDALHGSDALATSDVLAKALGTLTWDLVLLGSESTDARMSVIPAMLAERLGAPQLTYASTVTVDGGSVRVERSTEVGVEVLEAALPAVVSIVEKANEPRYPSFKNIMAAKKKVVTTLTLADLGIDAGSVGLGAAWSQVVDATKRPPKAAGVIVTDAGDAGHQLVEYLVAQRLV